MYPTPSALQPTFDQYGNQLSVNPLVGRQSAGALAPGQTLFSCAGRLSNATGSATTFPVVTVPSNMVLYITDFSASTVGTNEVDVQLQSGTIPVARASVFSTSPCSELFETQPMVIGGNTLQVVLGNSTSAQVVDFYVGGYMQALGF